MLSYTLPSLLPTISPVSPDASELPRPLWEALLVAPNGAISRESRARR